MTDTRDPELWCICGHHETEHGFDGSEPCGEECACVEWRYGGKPTALPATLRTPDDVAAVCAAEGLARLEGEDAHPNAWVSPDRWIAVAIAGIGSTMTGIAVQRIEDWDSGQAQIVATLTPYVASDQLLTAAIRAARTAGETT